MYKKQFSEAVAQPITEALGDFIELLAPFSG